MGIVLNYSSYTPYILFIKMPYLYNCHIFLSIQFVRKLDAEAFDSAFVYLCNQQKVMNVCCIHLGSKGNIVMYKPWIS